MCILRNSFGVKRNKIISLKHFVDCICNLFYAIKSYVTRNELNLTIIKFCVHADLLTVSEEKRSGNKFASI